jgi:DinB family protein
MDTTWKASLWRGFGRVINQLEVALRDCPDELWGARLWEVKPHHPGVWPVDGSVGVGIERPNDSSIQVFSAFWYLAYHVLAALDFNLSGRVDGFVLPSPFSADEHGAGVLPKRVYTRPELHDYLAHNRQRCQATIEGLTDQQARRVCKHGSGEVPFAELLIISLCHVQEHGAQLNMFLGQQPDRAPTSKSSDS